LDVEGTPSIRASVRELLDGLPDHERDVLLEKLYRWTRTPADREKGGLRCGFTHSAFLRTLNGAGPAPADARFERMEAELGVLMDDRAEKGLYSNERWQGVNARRLVRSMLEYREGTPPQLTAPARAFRGSHGWQRRFVKRHKFGVLAKSNSKIKSVRERLPLMHRFLWYLRTEGKPLRDARGNSIVPGHPEWPALTAEQRTHGRFPPERVHDVDQVCLAPLPPIFSLFHFPSRGYCLGRLRRLRRLRP
jgi:hypothetical protein